MALDLFGNPIGTTSLSKGIAADAPSYTTGPSTQASPSEALTEEVSQTHYPIPLLVATLAVASVLIIQCTRLQIIQGRANHALAQGNSEQLLRLTADRGLIIDAQGVVLAENTRKVALLIDPQKLPTKRKERDGIYDSLKKVAGVSQEAIAEIEANWKKAPESFVIKEQVSKDEALLYREQLSDLPGVAIREIPVRSYAAIPALGQLLGYVGAATKEDVDAGARPSDRIGKSGIEQTYQDKLRGTDGIQHTTINALGEVLEGSTTADPAPIPGDTVKLSIDSKLQTALGTALQHAVERRAKEFGAEKSKNLGASAVVIRPNTGEVIAMASLPNYDANTFARGITGAEYKALITDKSLPLLNRAIAGQYPSASTIKPLVASAGLQEGVITPTLQVTTPAYIEVGGIKFPDWKTHGLTNVRKAISESNNIFFFATGGGWKQGGISGLGIDRLDAYLGKFGLGKDTGIDIPGEESGRVPTPAWKEQVLGEPWYIGDTYNTSIGQGNILVTPLQMANAIATIANGGNLYAPTLVHSFLNPVTKSETRKEPKVSAASIIRSDVLQVVREGMRATVADQVNGSARNLNKLATPSAGKTGTAEFGSEGRLHGWYVGFAPYDNPEIAVAVVIEGGGEGYRSALPVYEEIMRSYFNEPLAEGAKLFTEPAEDPNNPFQGER